MRMQCLLILTGLMLVGGCAPAPEAPKDAREAARTQAELSTDAEQARLWQEAAESGTTAGMEQLSVEGSPVRTRQPAVVPDQAVEAQRKAYPETIQSAVTVVSAAELDAPFSGPARVASTDGEFLTLDLGEERVLSLQTKVRGGPLRVKEGETAELLYRAGDPFARNDVIALKLEDDDLLYALVGADGPVSLELEAFDLTAKQVGEPKDNTMAVEISSGGESHTLSAGEQATLRKPGLTVEVKASVAVQGESAYALPGRPYRIELLGWRTK